MFKEIIERLLAFPQRGAIAVDIDRDKRNFSLSVPIFSSRAGLSNRVREYVRARKDAVFQPHATSFLLEENRVILKQEIPFAAGFQDTLRNQVDQFWQMSRVCHRMLTEIAVEEQYEGALDSHFEE